MKKLIEINNYDSIGSFFTDKTILLIGGTGSVGRGMVKRLLSFNPKAIRLYSRDEYKQFIFAREYENEHRLRYLIGDVRDYTRVERAMKGADLVFNLAAMKHVPACEYNPFEAVKTNVMGTQNVIEAAINCNVDKVVLTSSDKAINSTNAMGATKLLGERLMNSAQIYKGNQKTSFSVVRFGNVMGSRGSVIPLFKKQILENKKITVTDPEMTRFMMSNSQAVNLTLKAMAISYGGEIFVLKMPVMRLGDLADGIIEMMHKKYGVAPENVEKVIIGLREGEKAYEELMTITESTVSKEMGDMYVILSNNIPNAGLQYYDSLENAKEGDYTSHDSTTMDKGEILKLLEEEELL